MLRPTYGTYKLTGWWTCGPTDLQTYGVTDHGTYGLPDLRCGCTVCFLGQGALDLDWPPVSGSLDVIYFAAPWTYGFSDARWTCKPVDDRLLFRPIRDEVELWACSLAALRRLYRRMDLLADLQTYGPVGHMLRPAYGTYKLTGWWTCGPTDLQTYGVTDHGT